MNPRFEKVSLVRELVDPMCFMIHDAQGPSHAACAELRGRGGQTLAFADRARGPSYFLQINEVALGQP